MAEPLVSVIIPCYNAEAYLAETINSALTQSYKNLEIIVVDDQSTDGSAQVMRSFGSKIRTDFAKHSGASETRNRGTGLAQGAYIQYLDADDILRPDAVEARVRALESSGADVAYSDWQELKEIEDSKFRLSEIHNQKIEDVHANPEIAIFSDFWAPPAALLYRRKIVEQIGAWNKNLPIIQDARFLLDARLKGGRFIHVPGISAEYRVHLKESLSRRDPLAFIKDIFTNAMEVQTFWEQRGTLDCDQKEALISTYEYAARNFFEMKAPEFNRAIDRLRLLDNRFHLKYSTVAHLLKSITGYSAASYIMSFFKAVNHAKRRLNG
jgi:glycosyltransferase involved in cell wall biosynthesis